MSEQFPLIICDVYLLASEFIVALAGLYIINI